MPKYSLWGQIAGYFDGDGTICFSDTTNQPYKLSVSLIFVDQSYDQISNVKEFLNQRGIRTSNILKTSLGTANMVAVSEFNSVRFVLKEMSPFLWKKENEAHATLDYYEGRITGNELIAIFGVEVEAGRRERRPRKVALNVPYNRIDGDRIMKEIRKDRLRDAFGRYRSIVTQADYLAIRAKHFDEGKRLRDLVKEYPQYARETIRRVMGGGRGYVGVKGLGRVDTRELKG